MILQVMKNIYYNQSHLLYSENGNINERKRVFANKEVEKNEEQKAEELPQRNGENYLQYLKMISIWTLIMIWILIMFQMLI